MGGAKSPLGATRAEAESGEAESSDGETREADLRQICLPPRVCRPKYRPLG